MRFLKKNTYTLVLTSLVCFLLFGIISLSSLCCFNNTSKFANSVLCKIGLKEKRFYSTEELFGMSWEEHWKLRQAEMAYTNKLLEESKKTGKLELSKLYTDFYPNYNSTKK